MPRAKKSTREKAASKQTTSSNRRNAAEPDRVAALIEQRNIALSRVEPELAAKFFSKALDLRPDDAEVNCIKDNVLYDMSLWNLCCD